MIFSAKAVASALMVATLMCAGAAEARERHVSRTWTNQRGTFTAQADVVREPGSRSRHVVITQPDGHQRIISDQRTWNRQTGTMHRDHSVTFADGSRRTLVVDAHQTAPGEFAYTRTVTGRDGESRTQTGTYVVTRRR
jgi:hypothetical protein